MNRILLAAACATILVGAASCGGGNESSAPSGRPTAAWTQDFCTAFQTWRDGTSTRSEQMQYQLAQVRERLGEGVVRVTPADFAEIRSLSVDEIGDYITLTDEAIQSMREAGHPAVENGAQISSALTGLLMDLRPVFVGWREKARDLPINDPDRFVQGARELGLGAGPQIEAVLSEQAIDDRLPDSFPRELRDAFRNEPACDGFRAANPEMAPSGTATSLQSEDVLSAETFEAQQVLSDKSAFYDTLTSKQQRALDELQALLYTNSGITPDEAARTQTLLEILDQK